MIQYFNQTYIGTYQLVSDSCVDPIMIFRPPFYQQTSYTHQIDPYYIHQSSLPYPEYFQPVYAQTDPYQQQHIFNSATLPNSISNSSSHKVGNARFNPWKLQQLSEIKVFLQHAMKNVENIQSILNKYANPSTVNTPNFISLIPKPAATKNKVAAKAKSDPAHNSSNVDALPAKGAEAKKPSFIEKELDVKAPEAVAPAKAPAAKVAVKEATPMMKMPAKNVTMNATYIETYMVCIFNMLTQVHLNINISYFKFKNINCFEIVLGGDECKVFDVLLERNVKKFFENIVFIFDPGGEESVNEVSKKWFDCLDGPDEKAMEIMKGVIFASTCCAKKLRDVLQYYPQVYQGINMIGNWNMMDKTMVNGGLIATWACITFAKNVSLDAAIDFCRNLIFPCQNSGKQFICTRKVLDLASGLAGLAIAATYNLSKAIGLTTIIHAMRLNIHNIEEYEPNTSARVFSVVVSALSIPTLVQLLKAVIKKSMM